MSINSRRTTTTEGAHTRVVGILSFFSLSLLVKSSEDDILIDIMWPISQSHFHVSFLCSLK